MTVRDDDDKPRTEAEMRALTDRQAGFPDVMRDVKGHAQRWGDGFHGSINAAIFGIGSAFLDIPLPADFRPVTKRWSLAARHTAGRIDRALRNGEKTMTASSDLSGTAFRRLYGAVWYAQLLEVSLNVWGTFAWHVEFGSNESAGRQALAQYFKYSGQWLADHGHPDRAHVWVDENPDGRFHTHFLQHVPSELVEKFKSWSDRYCRRSFRHGHAEGKLLKREVRTTPSTRGEFEKLSYMCKGYDRQEILFHTSGSREPVRLGHVIQDHYADPGVITGRRYGIARILYKRQIKKAFSEAQLNATRQGPNVTRSEIDRQIAHRVLDGAALYPATVSPMFEARKSPSSAQRRRERAIALLQNLSDHDVHAVLSNL